MFLFVIPVIIIVVYTGMTFLEHSFRYRSIKYSQLFWYYNRRLAWWYIGLDIGNILTL